MSRFSRFGRAFSGFGSGGHGNVIGISALLSSAGTLTMIDNALPAHEFVTAADTGHPHLTTQSEPVQDPMEDHPTIVTDTYVWPRLPTDHYTDSTQTISAQEVVQMEHADLKARAAHLKELQSQMQAVQQTQETTTQSDTQTTNEFETEVAIEMSQYIDHTALKAFTSKDDIKQLCTEAMGYNFASVCVNPVWVEYCSQLLKNSNVTVCTVIGFPLGANTTQIKVLEALQAVQDGATEIDMVISVSHIKSQEWGLVELDIASVVQAVQGPLTTESENNKNSNNKNVIVKVILETSMLTKSEIVKSCEICVKAGADYVKTSTGFGGAGATVENVKLMKQSVENELKKQNKKKNSIGIKASGGVRNYHSAQEMIKAGASRIGTSSGVKIIGKDKKENTASHATAY